MGCVRVGLARLCIYSIGYVNLVRLGKVRIN
jgi:hypothetical protein